MVDKLIIKDVQLTAANDDNYFVFEDFILQVQYKNDIRLNTHLYIFYYIYNPLYQILNTLSFFINF